ncbi:hypothetical protein KCG43_20265 [Photobacterium sp. WH24]|uniref:hypothetical protein n=1 Tax=Photobacterium sp. WH24 TaxID=2827237 RepID=UPI001C478EBB|nr:hypothetical protein [Photobacterium sp. WH24]MBV7264350.1 hypothetical protein [Photobacterium sp. WH24]
MPFPPPTHGFEERHIADSLDEHLVPNKSAIEPYKATADLQLRTISKGDVITIEKGRAPHHQCVALIEQHGDVFLAVLYWHHGRWFARTDEHKGAVSEDMTLIGIARDLIKDQLQ